MDRWRSGGPQGKGESGAELRGRERQRASRRGRRACQVGPTRQWRGASGPCVGWSRAASERGARVWAGARLGQGREGGLGRCGGEERAGWTGPWGGSGPRVRRGRCGLREWLGRAEGLGYLSYFFFQFLFLFLTQTNLFEFKRKFEFNNLMHTSKNKCSSMNAQQIFKPKQILITCETKLN